MNRLIITNTFSLRMMRRLPAHLIISEVVPRPFTKNTTWAEWMAEYIEHAKDNGIESVVSNIWDENIARILGLEHNPTPTSLLEGDYLLVALPMNNSETYKFRFCKISLCGKAKRRTWPRKPRKRNMRNKSAK